MTGPGWAACHGPGDKPPKAFSGKVTAAPELTAAAAEAAGRLAALDAAAAAWADAYLACTPAEREQVRLEAERLGLVDPATWAAMESLALEQKGPPWRPR